MRAVALLLFLYLYVVGIAVEYLGGEFGSLMGGLIYDALY